LATTNYTFSKESRLIQATFGNGDKHDYVNDANGNRTQRKFTPNGQTSPTVTEAYGYDHNNRLSSYVKTSGTATVANFAYVHAPTGQRISKKDIAANTTAWYMYDMTDVVTDYTQVGSGSLTHQKSYICALGGNVAQISASGGAKQYFVSDGVGSVTHLLDGSQAIIMSKATDAWGSVVGTGGSASTRYGFLNSEADPESASIMTGPIPYDPSEGMMICGGGGSKYCDIFEYWKKQAEKFPHEKYPELPPPPSKPKKPEEPPDDRQPNECEELKDLANVTQGNLMAPAAGLSGVSGIMSGNASGSGGAGSGGGSGNGCEGDGGESDNQEKACGIAKGGEAGVGFGPPKRNEYWSTRNDSTRVNPYFNGKGHLNAEEEEQFWKDYGKAGLAGAAAGVAIVGAVYVAPAIPEIIAALGAKAATSATVATVTAVAAANANKLNHIFGKQAHNLQGLLGKFGGNQQSAFGAVQSAAQKCLNAKGFQGGLYKETVNVAGEIITVEGKVIDGVLHVGSFWKP
jgi:hypothetical protein